MPAKRELLGQGDRGKRENVCEAFNHKPTNGKFSHILALQ